MRQGKVLAIFIASRPGGATEARRSVLAEPAKGIQGDRYFRSDGSWATKQGSGRQITLIEVEAIRSAESVLGHEIPLGSSRRNIITEGISLNELVGKEFSVGETRLLATRLCDPCKYLGQLTSPALSEALKNRGGLRCDILQGGEIRVGDPVISE